MAQPPRDDNIKKLRYDKMTFFNAIIEVNGRAHILNMMKSSQYLLHDWNILIDNEQ